MNRTDWVNRCAKRLLSITGDRWSHALRDAASLADEQTVRHGASAIAWEGPEDAAEKLAAGEDEKDGS